MKNDFPKVIGVTRIRKEAFVANRLSIMGASETQLLHVADALKYHTDSIEHNSRNVSSSSKAVLLVLRHFGRVDECDWQRNSPDPNHLEDPEAQEGKELAALVIEAVIFARLEDAVEEEAGETHRPDNDEQRSYDLASMVMAAEGEGEDGEEGEIGSAGKI